MTRWRNWSRSVTAWPVEVAAPRSAPELAQIIQRAVETGRTVKAVGAGHSFTAVAATNGIQLDLQHLRGALEIDRERSRVRLNGGTRLHEIPDILDPLGLAMENLGDIDRQTITGATSTGTHGTGLAYGGLATQIVAATLIDGHGTTHTINERENAELLPAVALGIGALGVLADVTIQCVPAFSVTAVESVEPIDAVLSEWRARNENADHFEFYWFPHTADAVTKTNTRGPAGARDPRSPVADWIDANIVMNGLFRGLCSVGAKVPAVVPPISRLAAKSFSDGTYTDRSDRVFVARRPLQFVEMEYAVDFEAIPDIQRELTRMIERRGLRLSFPVEFRAAGPDELLLSTANGRRTAYVAIHRFWREDPTEYFAEAERIFLDHGGRPHWGKMHNQTAETLRDRVPGFEAFRAVRERLDPSRTFTNDYLRTVLGD
ncbi:FAD-binding protein [Epidermidibacterium keratini]|uniref:FAD-binding protein n=1 Tax=Epidermidibacterium keratini TaxID=1891644 RepID=A0A7L4YR99_9ACTN|nr:D-arabinono-1,4-lactone oxidase [Epidermidibacterium keratini]QHC01676.1 FAD-binding protein [Epidermidibacterium keratini]